VFAQALINLVALAILATITIASLALIRGHATALIAAVIVPIAIGALIVAGPALLARARRSHHAHLSRIAGWLSDALAHGNSTALLVIWILWAVLLLRLLAKVYEWVKTYFVVTSQRMLLSTGVITHKVNMMPLTKVTDMSFQRTATGRVFGYGEFIVESAGQDQALSNIKFLPYPEQLYLEVCGLIFKDKDESPD